MRGLKRICLVVPLVAGAAVGSQSAMAECGIASHYSEGSHTASGEHFNAAGVSAAHRTLPFGTIVRVTHKRTGRSIEVRINDRGPFVSGRIIDLSTGAKRLLGMDGLAPVCLQVVSYGHGRGGRVYEASRHRSPDLFAQASNDDDNIADRSRVRRAHRAGHQMVARVRLHSHGTKYASLHSRHRLRQASAHHRRRLARQSDGDSET